MNRLYLLAIRKQCYTKLFDRLKSLINENEGFVKFGQKPGISQPGYFYQRRDIFAHETRIS